MELFKFKNKSINVNVFVIHSVMRCLTSSGINV